MPKVLKVAVVSLGVFLLSSAMALAQTTPPPSDPGHAPTTSHSKRKAGTKKAGHKKTSTKKKAPKKTAPAH